MIHAEQLTYGFADKDLYHKISFTLPDNRHCVLIGSNGSGKTTLVDLIHRPEEHLFDGKLTYENIGRIGYASQFASRDKQIDLSVTEYLGQDFLKLQAQIDRVCERMAVEEDLEALMEEYQSLLDESDAMDCDNYERNIIRQLRLSGLAAAQRAALGQQFGSGRMVDRAVYAASAQQRGLGRIDNGVHLHLRYIVSDDLDRHGKSLLFKKTYHKKTRLKSADGR